MPLLSPMHVCNLVMTEHKVVFEPKEANPQPLADLADPDVRIARVQIGSVIQDLMVFKEELEAMRDQAANARQGKSATPDAVLAER